MRNYFSADYNETNTLSGKLLLTNATVRHSLPYPGISFGTPLCRTLIKTNN